MSKLFTGDGSGVVLEIDEVLNHNFDVKEIACSFDALTELKQAILGLAYDKELNSPEDPSLIIINYVLADGRIIPVRAYSELQGLTWEVRYA